MESAERRLKTISLFARRRVFESVHTCMSVARPFPLIEASLESSTNAQGINLTRGESRVIQVVGHRLLEANRWSLTVTD